MLNIHRTVRLLPTGAAVQVRQDALLSSFNLIEQSITVVVGSTGNKTFTFTVLGQSASFVTTFATTGTYVINVAALVRYNGTTQSVMLFPPTYISKSAGTTPTNSVLKSVTTFTPTLAATGQRFNVYPTTGIMAAASIIKLGTKPRPTPGCINWLVASARDANLTSSTGNTGTHTATEDYLPVMSDDPDEYTPIAPSVTFGELSVSGSSAGTDRISGWHQGDLKLKVTGTTGTFVQNVAVPQSLSTGNQTLYAN